MGALTSKPYAFIARPWELKSVSSISLTDGEGINIKINIRGNEILRILPAFNKYINTEWISDLTRFNYDGFSKNRLRFISITMPALRRLAYSVRLNNRFSSLQDVRLDWSSALEILINSYDFKKDNLISLVSSNIDLFSIISLRKLLSKIGSSSFVFEADNVLRFLPLVNARKNRITNCLPFNNDFEAIGLDQRLQQADFILVLNSNIKLESPVLFSKILKYLNLGDRAKKLVLFNSLCGNVEAFDLGNDLKMLKKFLQGRHKFSSILAASKNPFFIFGNSLIKCDLGNSVINLFSNLCISSLFKNVFNINWNPFFFISNASNTLALSLLSANNAGVTRRLNNLTDCALFIVGDITNTIHFANFVNDLGSFKFIIHQKSFLNSALPRDNQTVIELPQLHSTECRLKYINQFFSCQSSEIAVSASSDSISKKGWHIIEALSTIWLGSQNYQSEFEMENEINKNEPYLFINTKNIEVGNNIISSDSVVETDFVQTSQFLNYAKNYVFLNSCWSNVIERNNAHLAYLSNMDSLNSSVMTLAQKKRGMEFNAFCSDY